MVITVYIIKETDPHQTTLLLATQGQLLSSLSEKEHRKETVSKRAKKNFGGNRSLDSSKHYRW